MQTKVEIRNKKYYIDLKIKNEIISVLMDGGKNFVEFMEFFTDDEIQNYFNSFFSIYAKNNNIFKQIKKVLQKDRKLAMFLLYATVMKNVDVGLTLKCDRPISYQSLMNLFDKSAFFALEDPYRNFINGKDVLGRFDVQEKNPTLFATSYKTAKTVITNMLKEDSLEKQKQLFTQSLGFNNDYLNGQSALYLLQIDGKQIKKDATCGKEISIHLPNGTEPGVNEFWIVGGYTSGGIPEIVVGGLPNIKKYIPKVIKCAIKEKEGKFTGPEPATHKYSSKLN